MGAAVDALADYAIITNDNPRKEDPMAIIEDIKPGFRRLVPEVIADRKEAIYKAVAMAQPRDIVLIAGKGHENYQETGDSTIPFDDVAVAASAMSDRRETVTRAHPRKPRDSRDDRPPRGRERGENEAFD
jgi:UDP-N-acetylmuramoyl-L-alanyl-D-glutamate--2,6-diaminopimelate ligase